MEKYKVIIVDDHLLFSQGLKLIIEHHPSYEVLEILNSSNQVIESVRRHQVDIILLDVNLGTEFSFDLCKKIKKNEPNVKIIAISMHHEYRIISQMMEHGADAYIFKNSDIDTIQSALAAVLKNETFLDKEIEKILSSHKTESLTGIASLNSREKKVLDLIIADNTSKAIAAQMNVSIKTVEFYRSNIYSKMGVKNLLQLLTKIKDLNY